MTCPISSLTVRRTESTEYNTLSHPEMTPCADGSMASDQSL